MLPISLPCMLELLCLTTSLIHMEELTQSIKLKNSAKHFRTYTFKNVKSEVFKCQLSSFVVKHFLVIRFRCARQKTRERPPYPPANKLSLAAHLIDQSDEFWNNLLCSIVEIWLLCIPLETTTWAYVMFEIPFLIPEQRVQRQMGLPRNKTYLAIALF